MEVMINGCRVEINGLSDIIAYKKRLYQEVVNLREELKEKEADLKKVETYLKYNCQHNWITDSVDSMKGYKQGIIIKYCEKCELSA
jgi:cell shape-determining protein MreC